MNNSLNFRIVNSFESEIIRSSISTISSNLWQDLKEFRYFLFISFQQKNLKNKFPEIFLLTNDQKDILHSINPQDDVFSMGLYFGFIKNKNFYLSLEGAEFLSKIDRTSYFEELILNEKGEKSIIYGNDILLENVVKFSRDPKKDDFLLVKNNHDEIIACAKM
ncbi:MAG: hypothetical protein ACFFCC_11415, partial [Promethearchaeota archaeon]